MARNAPVGSRAFGRGRAAPAELPGDVRAMNVAATALALLGVALVVAAAMLWLARQPVFAIRGITVDGDVARNSVSTIRANAAPRLAGNFLTLDLAAVRGAFEAVPWVRHAVVRRVWPNRLRVRLEEHRAVALWSDDESVTAAASERLVNSHGELFEANVGDVEDDALLMLGGPEGSSAHVLSMSGRLGPVFAPLNAKVEQLALSRRGSWETTLDSGAVVELGRGNDDDVIARATRFVATVGEVTGRFRRPLAHADLRHPDGYAVRLRGVTTLPAAKKN